MIRLVFVFGSLVLFGIAGWWGSLEPFTSQHNSQTSPQKEIPSPCLSGTIAPGIQILEKGFQSILLEHGGEILLIDPVVTPEEWKQLGFPKAPTRIILARHDRHVSEPALLWAKSGVTVAAPPGLKEVLLPNKVQEHWRSLIPLRSSRCLYFMPYEGLNCEQLPELTTWGPWKLKTIPLPGPSPDHFGFLISKSTEPNQTLLYCGNLCTGQGKIFAPFTTDWDHWTDQGLLAHSQSLDTARNLGATILVPSMGPIIAESTGLFLEDLKKRVNETGFLKSFERFTKKRLGSPPNYRFLAREQAESNGAKPWSQLSPHLWITGNTYILVSRSGDFIVVDPWDPHSAKQIPKLKNQENLGNLEGILCTHAHFDHFDGAYTQLNVMGGKKRPTLWSHALVAEPLENPFRYWAPFLDERPLVFDKKMETGEGFTWREYSFRFFDFPGQTRFTQAIHTTIDGRICLFTGDNFFHQDQFSGSGGWMGLNRSTPLAYSLSAKKVLELAPEWVLAEHGGPFEFHPEDFRRRVEWGQAAAKAADSLCLSGNHLVDWNPHGVRWEPIAVGKSGEKEGSQLVVQPLDFAGNPEKLLSPPGFLGKDPRPFRNGFSADAPWSQKDGNTIRTRVFWDNGKIMPADCFQLRK